MEVRTENVTVTERVKVLAWEDALLDRTILVDLVCVTEAHSLKDLAARIHLGDLIDAVRKAHDKLPKRRNLTEAEKDLGQAGAAIAVVGWVFELPREVVNKRFVLPVAFEEAVKHELFTRSGFGLLRPLLTGQNVGGPLYRLGMLGRAAQEERTGLGESPYYYATLLLIMSFLSDQIIRKQGTPVKIKEAFDTLRNELKNWTARYGKDVHQAEAAARVLANPLAPYALRRVVPPASVTDIVDQYISYPNDYPLTPALLHALDAFYEGDIRLLIDDEAALESFRLRVQAYLDAGTATTRMLDDERSAVRRFGRRMCWLVASVTAMLVLPWLFVPFEPAVIAVKLIDLEALRRAAMGLVWSAGAAVVIGMAGLFQLGLRRRLHAGYQTFRKLRRALQSAKPVRAALRALPAFAGSSGDFRRDVPRILQGYLRSKTDALEYHRLVRLELPPLDSASLYSETQLRDKWSQNACVAYEDVYPSLVLGTSNTAAVYFIDVVGSTELSTQQTLSNALELYSRMIKQVNESGFEPLWRKEVGDGRIYSRAPFDALKRAVLSVQGSLHPKIGFKIGVGLSVGEIYRDVTTGDFLNEVTNRASRLNGRDDLVGAWVKARYVHQPFRVHVKYGRLYNAGVAMDENAMHTFGAEGWAAQAVVPPCEYRYPAIAETNAGWLVGTVSFIVERLDPTLVADRLDAVRADPGFAALRATGNPPLGFEVFLHATESGLRHPTPLEGRTVEDYLHLHAADTPAYAGRDSDRVVAVNVIPIALPSGETFNLVVKPERASLKGLGLTAIAEVQIPAAPLDDPDVQLGEFLSKL